MLFSCTNHLVKANFSSKFQNLKKIFLFNFSVHLQSICRLCSSISNYIGIYFNRTKSIYFIGNKYMINVTNQLAK